MSNVEGKINSSFRETFSAIIRSQQNRHLDFLRLTLEHSQHTARELFQYGFDNLPSDSERPDLELATYFLVVSELSDLPPKAQSLALDSMIYCENETGGPDSLRPDLMVQEYQVILPTLR